MPSVLQRLEIVVRSHSSGRLGAPQRIALPSDLFAQFQTDYRKLADEVGIEAIYPGSILGVPVVESAGHSATVTAADGTQSFLQLNVEGSELPGALLRPVPARP